MAEKEKINREKILEDLEQARREALESGKFSAAVRAAELLGKHLGMFRDPEKGRHGKKVEIHVVTGVPHGKDMG